MIKELLSIRRVFLSNILNICGQGTMALSDIVQLLFNLH